MIAGLTYTALQRKSSGGVTPPSDTKYPLTIGSDLVLWMNGRERTSKTTSDDLNSTIESAVSDDAAAHVLTRSSVNKNFFSGDWLYSPTTGNLVNAETTPYTFLHNGSNFEVWADVYPIALGAISILLQNNGGTTSQIGFNLVITTTRAVRLQITRGVAGQSVRDTTVSNVINIGEWNTIRVVRTGTTITISIRNSNNGGAMTQVSSVAADIQPPVATAPSSSMSTCGISSATNNSTLFRHVIAIKRNLTGAELTSMLAYMEEGKKIMGSGEVAYVGMLWGQSNALGASTSGVPPVDRQNKMAAFITSGGGVFNGALDYPINQQADTGTSFGPEIEFLYQMSVLKPSQTFLFKRAISGTTMYGSGNTAWNITTGNLGNEAILNMTTNFFRELKYRFNRTIKVKFLLFRQGESDCTTGNPLNPDATAIYNTFKSQLTDLYKKVLDDGIAAGYDMSKCQFVASLMNYSGVGTRPFNDQINQALTEVALNFRTENPTYAAKCSDGHIFSTSDLTVSDGTHFNGAGYIANGLRFYNAISPTIDI